jgi:hypothetical protein
MTILTREQVEELREPKGTPIEDGITVDALVETCLAYMDVAEAEKELWDEGYYLTEERGKWNKLQAALAKLKEAK